MPCPSFLAISGPLQNIPKIYHYMFLIVPTFPLITRRHRRLSAHLLLATCFPSLSLRSRQARSILRPLLHLHWLHPLRLLRPLPPQERQLDLHRHHPPLRALRHLRPPPAHPSWWSFASWQLGALRLNRFRKVQREVADQRPLTFFFLCVFLFAHILILVGYFRTLIGLVISRRRPLAPIFDSRRS